MNNLCLTNLVARKKLLKNVKSTFLFGMRTKFTWEVNLGFVVELAPRHGHWPKAREMEMGTALGAGPSGSGKVDFFLCFNDICNRIDNRF